MKKILLIFLFFVIGFTGFSQQVNNNEKVNNKKISIELNAGKLFSPYRFYKPFVGYENFSLGVSKSFSQKTGILISQSYGRLYYSNANNRTILMESIINPYLDFLTDKKINLRFSLGTGLTHLYTKCLYDIYPIQEHYYGMPIKSNIAVFYNLTEKLSISINLDASYSFLFYNGNNYLIINDPYYYKTFFYSANIGVSYRFGSNM